MVLIALLVGTFVVHQLGLDNRGLLGTRLYYGVTHFDSLHLLLQILVLLWIDVRCHRGISFHPLSLVLQQPSLWVLFSCLMIVFGFFGVVQQYAFALDEWAVLFQSQIFLQGHWHQSILLSHHELAKALTPYLILHDSFHQTWISFYLPIHTLFFTLFEFFKIGWMLNIVLTAFTALLLLQIHDHLWPDKKSTRIWVILLLISSAQSLCMAMSYFSMTSHFFMNVLWLRVSLETGKKRLWLLPISFLAMGLHQPFLHGLFIAPFLARWFFTTKNVLLRVAVTLFYLSALGFWIAYWNHSNPLFGTHSSMIGFPNALSIINQLCHLIRMVSWISPLIGIGLVCLWAQRPRISPLFQDLLLGVLLTFAFYFCFELSQGRGWGFRYGHGILQKLILLSLLGFYSLSDADRHFINRLWTPVLIYIFVILYPLKLAEIYFELKPYQTADQKIKSMQIDYVILSPHDAWYANDLIRNSPQLTEKPLRLNADQLSEIQIHDLISAGKAIRLNSDFYQECGIPLLISP